MEDRIHPVAWTCPHCGATGAKLMPPMGDYDEYACPTCDTYRISGTDKQLIEHGTADPTRGHIAGQNGRRVLVLHDRAGP